MKGDYRMLTKRGVDTLLQKVWETGGLTPDMEEDITRLRGEFDEREGMLRKFGEWYDGEDKDEFDYVPRETTNAGEGGEWEAKYNEMRERYINRFFGRDTADETNEEETPESNVPDEVKDKTLDELIRKEEE